MAHPTGARQRPDYEGPGTVIDRLHHVAIVTGSADDALGFYRDKLGLQVTEDRVMDEQGVRGVLLAYGESEVEILEPVQPDTGVARFFTSRGSTLHHFCFSTPDIRAELARIKALGDVELLDQEPRNGLAGEIAFLHPRSMHGVLIELAQTRPDAHHSDEKGVDHVVCRVANLEAAARDWERVLGLKLVNTIETPTSKIGQVQCGQAMIELIEPVAGSPMAEQLAADGERAMSMVAIDVPDIASKVAALRAAGVTLDDATPGVLPNSIRTSISAEQAFGMSVQLISFSRS
jgi:methylmalonyl-CoA/ethylmalonyl-CoA epimerase